ncbi:PH domain-containing protein [Sedimentisphaera salicampi]|uniref:Bacterial Pleckstrin homology domain-containing protein n=1 Tax=Sedimentisphaera salicampi TaxID=1941349 RepID=A0A1W6LP70_9BACT|nr:PH domain-containing protein [Sedimentisphaera salicampi]ARN57588.1 hypothetical protein STSP1_02003 [Sedimentisphaera salicampi]OXU14335.1 hypothetical protein SMSP1_01918 [Sedimentisphaera salicampi]
MGIISGIIGNAGVVPPEKLEEDYGKLLTDNEKIEVGFKLVRDTYIFTNKRMILIDKQGVTGKKTQYLSICYNRVSRFSIETAGHFDLDAELKIWLSGEDTPTIDKKFNRKVNIYDLQKVLAGFVLG